jgi:hypothetical protein
MSFSRATSPVRSSGWFLVCCAVLVGSIGTVSAVDFRLGLLMAGALAAVAGLFLFFHPRLALLLLVFSIPTQYWLVDDLRLLPNAFHYADDALFAILLLRILGDRLRSGRGIRRTPWDLPVFAFLAVSILSGIVNHVPFANMFGAIRAPILYGLTLLIVLNGREHFDDAFLSWIWKCLVVFFVLQIATALYQYPRRGFGADSLTGTLGPSGANDLGVVLIPFFFYLLSRRFDSGDRRVIVIVGALLMGLTMVLCGARAAWFSAIAAALVLWGRRLFRLGTVVKVALVLLFAYFVISQVVVLQQSDVSSAIGLAGIYAALFLVSSGGGNFAYYPIIWRLVHLYAPAPILGLGPGMVSSGTAAYMKAPLYRNVLYDYFGQTQFQLDGGVESQVLATAGEIGPFGYLALLSIVIIWASIGVRARRSGTTPEIRAMGAGVFAIALATILLTPIKNSWEAPGVVPFILWLSGSILYAKWTALQSPEV